MAVAVDRQLHARMAGNKSSSSQDRRSKSRCRVQPQPQPQRDDANARKLAASPTGCRCASVVFSALCRLRRILLLHRSRVAPLCWLALPLGSLGSSRRGWSAAGSRKRQTDQTRSGGTRGHTPGRRHTKRRVRQVSGHRRATPVRLVVSPGRPRTLAALNLAQAAAERLEGDRLSEPQRARSRGRRRQDSSLQTIALDTTLSTPG
jgi:hypothetical protein